MWARRGDAVEHHVDLAADQVTHCRAAAAVGHVNDVHTGHRSKQFACEVDRSAVAGGCERELARLRLGLCDQLG